MPTIQMALGHVSVISVPYALPIYNPFGCSFFLKHQMKAAGVGAQGEPNHCGLNVTGLSSFIAKKTAHETTVYIIQHMQWFFLF